MAGTLPDLGIISAFEGFSLTDLSPRTRDAGFTITRGTTSIVTTGFVANAGTFQTTFDNRDRTLDPNNSAGLYVTAGVSAVVPGVPILIEPSWNFTAYELLTATADDWPQDYPSTGVDQTVAFSATDGTAQFANGSLAITRPAEYTGARIQAVADAIGWAGPTAIAHGNAIVGPLVNPTVVSWSNMQDAANAEWGDLYFAVDGTLTFNSRDVIAGSSRTTSVAETFTDGSLPGLPFSDVTMGSPQLVNDCTVTYDDNGHTVNAQDATSIAAFGLRSLPVSLPIHTASQAQQYANWIVARYKTPITTFTSVTIKPQRDPDNLWPAVLPRELSDLITVVREPLAVNPDGTAAPTDGPISRDCWIRGIQHTYANREWSVTFYLQDASWLANLAFYDVNNWDDGSIYSL